MKPTVHQNAFSNVDRARITAISATPTGPPTLLGDAGHVACMRHLVALEVDRIWLKLLQLNCSSW